MINNILKLGKETLIYGTSTVAARLLNFFLVPLYTYYLIAADYGVIATVFAFMALTNVIYQYGMDQAYLRFRADNDGRGQRGDVFSTPFIAVALSAAAITAVLYLLSAQIAAALGLNAGSAAYIKLACAIMAVDALNIIPFAKLRYEHKPWYFVFARTMSIVVNVLGNVLALAYFKTGVAGIFYAGILASLTSLILLLPVIKEDFRFQLSPTLFKQMFKFAWTFIPAGMASILVNVIDKPLLSHLCGLEQVGIYQANFKIGVFMMLVVSMFDQAWRPFFIQAAQFLPDPKKLFAKVFTCFAALACWIFLGISLLMPVIIKTPLFGAHLLHPNYWGGLKIIPLVVGGYLFYGFYINFMAAPVLTKKTGVLMWITLLGAAFSVAVNLTLVPRFGIIGAGWAIFLSYVVMAGGLFTFLQRNYPIKYEYKRLALLALLTLAVLPALNAAILVKVLLLALYPFAAAAILLKVRPN